MTFGHFVDHYLDTPIKSKFSTSETLKSYFDLFCKRKTYFENFLSFIPVYENIQGFPPFSKVFETMEQNMS